jgi:hypothetical protein
MKVKLISYVRAGQARFVPVGAPFAWAAVAESAAANTRSSRVKSRPEDCRQIFVGYLRRMRTRHG